jgi:hypothetical protein
VGKEQTRLVCHIAQDMSPAHHAPLPRHGLNASWHSKAIQLSFLDPPRIRFTDSGDDHRSSDSESKLPFMITLKDYVIFLFDKIKKSVYRRLYSEKQT